MKKHIIVQVVMLLLVVYSLRSQTVKDINDKLNYATISNPDVFSFEKHNLKKVNHYVGKADISIPLYNIETGNINYPITLSYDSGGIKVDQSASDVGLGWNLSKTVITRIVNQANDFNSIGFNQIDTDYVFTDAVEQNKNFNVGSASSVRGNLGHFLIQKTNSEMTFDRRKVDFLPDTYNFHSNNYSTSFIFQDINTPVELAPKGTMISAVKGKALFNTNFYGKNYPNGNIYLYEFPTQDFFTIIVTTPDGIKYTFSDFDLSATFFATGFLGEYSFTPGGFINQYPAQISAWHITKIEDTNTGKKVQFYYYTTHSNPFNENILYENTIKRTQRFFNYFRIPYSDALTVNNCTRYWTGGGSSIVDYTLNSDSRVDVQKKRLSRIVFDKGEITFKYNNNEGANSGIGNTREDIYNGDFLTQMTVKNFKNEIIKTVAFKYDYFNSSYNVGEFNPDNEYNPYRYKRLKLSSIEESGKKPYIFTYIENIKLPPINSFSVDFLGYYNNSADVSNIPTLLSLTPNPKLYYYPNKEEQSLLPFLIPNIPNATINGYFNREANEFSKAWSLKKVEYPTGGFSEFEYESNTFNINGIDIKGGGIRIKKQILNDGLGNSRYLEYEYKKDNQLSSGNLDNFPFFGHPLVKAFNVQYQTNQGLDEDIPATITTIGNVVYDTNEWKLLDKSNLAEDITSGAFVGYSRVIERETGNGYKEFFYTSSETNNFKNKIFKADPYDLPVSICEIYLATTNICMSPFIKANSGMGGNIFTDNSYKRGKLLEENIFNQSNLLVKKTVNTYNDVVYNEKSFYQPITHPWRVQNENNIGVLFAVKKKYKISNYLLASETIKEYSEGDELSKGIKYTYNNRGLIKSSLENIDNGIGETKMTNVYYPDDITTINSLPNGSLATAPFNAFIALKQKNNINTPVQINTFKNNQLIFTKRALYKNWGNNIILPCIVQTAKAANNLEDKIIYNLVDTSNGNYLEAQQQNGAKISYIWGYNKTLLIAKIENAAYTDIPLTTINNLQSKSNSDTEANLIIALNNLRNSLPNGMVTTYTHKPLIGVSSITDPKGNTTYYEYDPYGRLKNTKDDDKYILKENEYHYKN